MIWFTFLPRLIAYGPKNNSSNGVDIDIVKLGGEEEEGGIAHWNEKLNNIFKEINDKRQNKIKNSKLNSNRNLKPENRQTRKNDSVRFEKV